MRILAIESSARMASVAIMQDSRLISELYTNTGIKHSQTLMPMIKTAFELAQLDISSIDLLATAIGPGSFTGIRIGIAAVKGISQATNKPCIGISTLEAMAYNLLGYNCVVCSVMDARCSQVYTALFECQNHSVTRLTDDSAILITELENQLKAKHFGLPVVLIGDGSEICYHLFKDEVVNIEIASDNIRFQRASGVAAAAFNAHYDINNASAEFISSLYLRSPQAERQLKMQSERMT